MFDTGTLVKTEHCGPGCKLRDYPRGRAAPRCRVRPPAVLRRAGTGVAFPPVPHPDRPAAQAPLAARHRLHDRGLPGRRLVDRPPRADPGRAAADHVPGLGPGAGRAAVPAEGQGHRGGRRPDLDRRCRPGVCVPVDHAHRPGLRLVLALVRGGDHRGRRVRRRGDRTSPVGAGAGHPHRYRGRPGVRYPGRADQADPGNPAGHLLDRAVHHLVGLRSGRRRYRRHLADAERVQRGAAARLAARHRGRRAAGRDRAGDPGLRRPGRDHARPCSPSKRAGSPCWSSG